MVKGQQLMLQVADFRQNAACIHDKKVD